MIHADHHRQFDGRNFGNLARRSCVSGPVGDVRFAAQAAFNPKCVVELLSQMASDPSSWRSAASSAPG